MHSSYHHLLRSQCTRRLRARRVAAMWKDAAHAAFYADLHIHSKHSKACSRDCDLEHLAWWGKRKGITVIGTSDRQRICGPHGTRWAARRSLP